MLGGLHKRNLTAGHGTCDGGRPSGWRYSVCSETWNHSGSDRRNGPGLYQVRILPMNRSKQVIGANLRQSRPSNIDCIAVNMLPVRRMNLLQTDR
jgi:hypothetical protein